MKSLEPSQLIYQTFSPYFRVHAHHLIFVGYSDARHNINYASDETSITGFITEAIQNHLRLVNPPGWYKHYSIKDDPPIPTKGRTGRRRLRLDIIIEANWKGRPEYCFEAKRLHKSGFPASKYIGPDGMGCFIEGLYASRYAEAAMLGYVQSDSVEYWQKKIISEISRLATLLRLKLPQQNVKIIDFLPAEWVSIHERKDATHPIGIYHILLDCH